MKNEKTQQIAVRIPDSVLDQLDEYMKEGAEPDTQPNRADTIRSILAGFLANRRLAHTNWVVRNQHRFQELQAETYTGSTGNPLLSGYWMGAYSLSPEIATTPLPQFRERLERCVGPETGWPVGWLPTKQGIRPYPHQGALEVWLGGPEQDPGDSDFWCADPKGHFVLFRGHQEDTPGGYRNEPPKTCFDFVLPVWRTAEVLLHAARFVSEFAPDNTMVKMTFAWKGLRGRRLSTHQARKYSLNDNRVCRTDEIRSEINVDGWQIARRLPQLVRQITQPLYAAFDCFELPIETLEVELNELRYRGRKNGEPADPPEND